MYSIEYPRYSIEYIFRKPYDIEVINNLNIDFIAIGITRTQSPTHNAAGILMSNSDPDLHFCPGSAKRARNRF